MKRWLKSIVFRLLASDCMLERRLAAIEASGLVPVLNFHRVSDDQSSAYQAMAPALFDDLLSWLKPRFSVTTFGKLHIPPRNGKPALVLSFDDGYRDFVDVVLPLLNKHGMQANQNIIPACVESGTPPMNVMVQDFIGQAPPALLRELVFPGLAAGVDPDDRVMSGIRVSAALKNRPIVEQKKIFAQLRGLMERLDTFRTTPMMGRLDIADIAESQEVGVHSFEHATMALECDDYLREDARRCADWYRGLLGAEPSVYAFPNGSARAGQAELILDAGYTHALLVGESFSRGEQRIHRRFTMYGNGLNEFRFRALGGRSSLNAG
jgi:peptidoglycan/xylan/chitin deacetylase (PgdA/CDA1 family)